MKLIFFGSSEFAVPSLGRLWDSPHEVLAVVTQPDRERGRHLRVQPTPVKSFASKKGLRLFQPEKVACLFQPEKGARLFQPEKISDPSVVKGLSALSADLFVVVAFGEILPRDILEIPRLYSINLHPSLLPKYRGAAPVNWAIINGETETGLTVIKMNEKMDAGDIILQKRVEIGKDDTSESLNNRLSELGGILLLDALRFIEEKRIKFKKQNEGGKSLAPRLKKEDGLIDWKKDAVEIYNRIRGTIPWPGAFTFLNGKSLRIWKSEAAPLYEKIEPASVLDTGRDVITIACGKGALLIKELQLEGKKRMDAASFLRGHKIEKGTFLGNP
jgi:methionyl-tRNA formyltransferase